MEEEKPAEQVAETPVKAVFGPDAINVDELDLDDIMAEAEQDEVTRIKNNLPQILAKVAMPEIEDLVTDLEPKFYEFEDIFNDLNTYKLEYFAKWMDLILLEEHYTFQRQ